MEENFNSEAYNCSRSDYADNIGKKPSGRMKHSVKAKAKSRHTKEQPRPNQNRQSNMAQDETFIDFSVSVPRDLKERLHQCAKDEGISVKIMVQSVLHKWAAGRLVDVNELLKIKDVPYISAPVVD